MVVPEMGRYERIEKTCRVAAAGEFVDGLGAIGKDRPNVFEEGTFCGRETAEVRNHRRAMVSPLGLITIVRSHRS